MIAPRVASRAASSHDLTTKVPSNMYTCRECESDINQATEICPQCGADLTQPPAGADTQKPKPTLGKILLRWGVLLSVLMAALWSFLWFIVPAQQGDVTGQAEARTVESLRELGAALGEYAGSQNGAYPQQIESLGNRVRTAAGLAQSVNYQIQYTAGPAEIDGSVRSYALQARAGNYGFRNFYMDQTGVIRATRENRLATAQDSPM